MTPRTQDIQRSLPRRFKDLAAMLPPQAIRSEAQYERTLAMIDRLMTSGRLSKGQELYIETLAQLVEVYEAEHHAIDVSDLRGLPALRHVLAENDMNAVDLARLLGVHASMGSKILKGERSLTVEHLRKLADRFKVSPELFMA